MRVTSPLPRLAAAGPDRASSSAGASAGAPAGEPFRTALRAAGTAGQPAVPGSRPDGAAPDPDDHGSHAGHADDTMAPAAAQAAYLARVNAASGLATPPGRATPIEPAAADPTRTAPALADPARPTRRATGPDRVDSASAALALSYLGISGAPGALDPAPGTAPGSAPTGAPGAATTGPLGASTLAWVSGSHRDATVDANRPTSPPQLPETALDPMTAAALRAAYGLAASAAPGGPGAPRQAIAVPDDAPADPSIAAAIGRAISTLGAGGASRVAAATGPGQPGSTRAANPTPAAAAADPAATTATAWPATAGWAASALTPLEQAVHDLVGRLGMADAAPSRGRAAKPADDDTGAGFSVLPGAGVPPVAAARDASGAAAPVHASAPAQPPEPPANPSHVHLVIDDGPERVVATVAVRGSEVHVTLRATDEATAAALARNAASLDHAMHGRGLDLSELTAERDPGGHAQHRDPEPHERRQPDDEPFELEE